MSLDSVRALALQAIHNVFSVSVTVTGPNDWAVSTSGIWMREKREDLPFGSDLQLRGARKIMSLKRTDDLTAAPRGTIITAPELEGGAVKTWRVDGYDGPVERDQLRVILVEVL